MVLFRQLNDLKTKSESEAMRLRKTVQNLEKDLRNSRSKGSKLGVSSAATAASSRGSSPSRDFKTNNSSGSMNHHHSHDNSLVSQTTMSPTPNSPNPRSDIS